MTMTGFRDPVHGFIQLTEYEQALVDSTPFQRLRNIRQLGTTYLIYHGAEHTRFGHSLGVMHLVTRSFDSTVANYENENSNNLFSSDDKINQAKIKWYRQVLRLIALTHDLGHPPFSHAGEGLYHDKLKHEHYTKAIIEMDEIAKHIKNIDKSLRRQLRKDTALNAKTLRDKYGIKTITPKLLWTVYQEKLRVSSKDYSFSEFSFIRSFMDGELDADKMDYLLRDSLYCGVNYGTYDLDRLFNTITIYKDKDKDRLKLSLALSSGGVQAFEEFVLARYFMFIQVYFHKTRRFFDKLLSKAISEILPQGKFPSPKDIYEYLKWDDTYVIHKMKKFAKDNPDSHSARYLTRKVMECVYGTSVHANDSDPKLLRTLDDYFKKEYSSEDVEIVVDVADKETHKLLLSAYMDSNTIEGADIKVINAKENIVENLVDKSLVLKGISSKINICRMYVSTKNQQQMNNIKKYIRNNVQKEEIV